MSNKTVFTCGVCKKTFNRAFNVKRHVRMFHPDQADILAPKRTFECKICNSSFPMLKELKVHKREHNKKAAPIRKDNKCPLCDHSDFQKKRLLDHFTEQHEITLKYSHHTFPSLDEFKAWVIETENGTKARFVKRRKADVTKAGQTIHYACHRSGNFISEGKGLRRLKRQGSHKIGSFCPGEIKLFINASGSCEVSFLETHVGHENEVELLSLRQSERQTIASKIAQKIPFKRILNEVRDSADNSQRIHLVKRKDLYNIEKSFKLQRALEHDGADDSVLFYKEPLTFDSTHPELNPEDFVLILMNREQEDMLKKYGSDCVCLDRIYGQNRDDFELHMLAVLDDQGGFPCAFLVSNRNDEEIMTIFLFYVAQKIGAPLEPKVFMSDMADCYYAAWLNVMVQPQLRFYCMWHIDSAWRSNLFRIIGKDKQDFVYNSLRTMLHEPNAVAFPSLLAQFFKEIDNDPDMVDFGDYFKENYEKCAGQWAFCFRLRYDVDGNMNLERLHKSIKKIYLSGERVKRLDKAINAISKFARERFRNRGKLMEVPKTEPMVDTNHTVEHAYAETEADHIPEENGDDLLYINYLHCEDSVEEESRHEYKETGNNSEMIEEINDAHCSSLVDKEKEELEASVVKIVRGITCMEQIKVFKALIAPFEPAMKAEENAQIER